MAGGTGKGQPSTPGKTVFDVPALGTVAAVVTGGGASFLNGSGMGTVEDCQLAGGLVTKPAGAVPGPPVTPKLLPLKFGPPWVKSICGLLDTSAAKLFFEFTCMLLVGPPRIFTNGVPPSLKLANSVGLSTRSGTEDRPPCNPHLAVETTSWTPLPPNMAEK